MRSVGVQFNSIAIALELQLACIELLETVHKQMYYILTWKLNIYIHVHSMYLKCRGWCICIAYMRRWLKAPRKCILPLQFCFRMMGPNCAAGLVLVLSVDTLVLQLATVSTVGYEQCIGHGWKGHRGRRGKCDLQSRLTPAGPTYHVPTMLRRALLMIRPTWLLRQSKQLKESETDGCWQKPGITIHFIFHNILKIFDWENSNVPFKLRY